jgi:Reverse transcriptase (RNA-dependent DNA polymerase)
VSYTKHFDQSFCRTTLSQVVWKRDFRGVPKAGQDAFREAVVAQAIASASVGFAPTHQPLLSFPLGGKTVYRVGATPDELVVRKLRLNLKACSSSLIENRIQIVKCLSLLLEEGIPYRVYRLDIRSFFESFDAAHVLKSISDLRRLSPQSKGLIANLLARHSDIGGTGIPRGLAISSPLSELLMHDFDECVQRASDTFFFARYVDDIIVVTSARETASDFLAKMRSWLPPALDLNPTKTEIAETGGKVQRIDSTVAPTLLRFDYLGYQFTVRNPLKSQTKKINKDGDLVRDVEIDIATKKVKKIKTRLVRSFLEFSKYGDWSLLKDRVAYLTQNFSVYNPKAGGKKIAGIFYSYPLAKEFSPGLRDLDSFLRNAVLAKNGRLFPSTSAILNGQQRRALLRHSFSRGHASKSFVHFSPQRIREIQSCWLH